MMQFSKNRLKKKKKKKLITVNVFVNLNFISPFFAVFLKFGQTTDLGV